MLQPLRIHFIFLDDLDRNMKEEESVLSDILGGIKTSVCIRGGYRFGVPVQNRFFLLYWSGKTGPKKVGGPNVGPIRKKTDYMIRNPRVFGHTGQRK